MASAYIAVMVVLSTFPANAFVSSPCFLFKKRKSTVRGTGVVFRYTSSPNSDDDDLMDDETLLRTVTQAQLASMCESLGLSTEGTKQVLLMRLRGHANEQAEIERQRIIDRAKRVEEGSDNAKERYEVVAGDSVDDEDDDSFGDSYFYFELPDRAINITAPGPEPKKPQHGSSIPHNVITAPPPPKQPNEKGERVVTVYNTAEENDLTGIAAAQPGQGANDNLMNTGSSASAGSQPWDMHSSQRSETTSMEVDHATETVTELVSILLASTGAPAFAGLGDDDDDDSDSELVEGKPQAEFVGFDPSKVSTQLLTTSSRALRTRRGQVLEDVIRKFELQAIGQDGMAVDDVEKGGGHYREVSKVHAFLDGFRRAENRRLARETSVMLLDKLVLEGVDGLDMMLAAMSRSSDDTAAFAGELNDSLLDFLNDAIRQQEKKVDQLVAERLDGQDSANLVLEGTDEIDPVNLLWNGTLEEGQIVESIDPNDPKVLSVLKREEQETEKRISSQGNAIPESAPEKLLLLLTLLRERIKAEAAFGPDEKGRNLRLLAHCLRQDSDKERQQLILKAVANSLDVSARSGCVPIGSRRFCFE